MNITVRAYTPTDLPRMQEIWNQVVEDGVAFPQDEALTPDEAAEFFAQQSLTAVACTPEGGVVGLYILHPNNVGRCGHICNASYAVDRSHRSAGIGRALVSHCLEAGRELGFSILQFNAVVASNAAALHLYASLGFTRLGTIPGGFRLSSGEYADIIPHYKLL